MKTIVEDGMLIIRTTSDDPPGGHGLCAPLDAIASWGELLGTGSDAETVAAMLQAHERRDSCDPQTGRNAWTGAYEALEAALDDTATAVSMLNQDGTTENDPLTAARNATRAKLGLPPIDDAAVQAITLAAADGDGTDPSTGIACPTLDTDAVRQALTDATTADALEAARERFYESLMPAQEQ